MSSYQITLEQKKVRGPLKKMCLCPIKSCVLSWKRLDNTCHHLPFYGTRPNFLWDEGTFFAKPDVAHDKVDIKEIVFAPPILSCFRPGKCFRLKEKNR